MQRAGRATARRAGLVALIAALAIGSAGAPAAAAAELPAAAAKPPPPRPAGLAGPAAAGDPAATAVAAAAPRPRPASAAAAAPARPDAAEAPDGAGRGPVTNLPLPRYVSLKTSEGNARRGPGMTHRIDWVFTRPGMPLRITAEHEHWRRVEDAEGAGGWVHYALLSGSRSVLVSAESADLRMRPDAAAPVVARVERGVVARVLECAPDWCRVNAQGTRGWLDKAALWGVDPGERID
jgi:SH3-like domain-containing protein